MTATTAPLDVRADLAGTGRVPPLAWVGAAILAAVLAAAVLAPVLADYRVTEVAGAPLEAPGAAHPLGTNAVGQDVWAQLVFGARTSLFVALAGGAGTVLVGAAVGLFAGLAGGRTDAVLMRGVDLVLVLPQLPLLIVLGAYVGTGLAGIAGVIAVTSWPYSARIVRSQVLSLRRRAHLRAAVGFGARMPHLLGRHVVPEIGPILAAAFVGNAGRAVMLEAGMAFLGLGDPSRASWGQIMRDALGFNYLFDTVAWSWWLLPPVVAITLLLLAITFVGLSAEQRLHPRLARHPGRRVTA